MLIRLAAVFVVVTAVVALGQSDRESPRFTIRWYGQAFFTVTTPSGRVVAFEPHVMPEFPRREKIKADIVCLCHPFADNERLEAAIEDAKNPKRVRVLRGYKVERPGRPWEWNLLDEKINVGGATYRFRTVGNYRDPENGAQWGKNTSFIAEIEGITFCHLGFLGHVLSEAELKAIGPVDVVFVPVGGVYMLNGADAKEVVASLKPRRFIFPMAYAVNGQPDSLLAADEFLDGLKSVNYATDSNEFSFDPQTIPQAPTTVVLNWRPGETQKN